MPLSMHGSATTRLLDLLGSIPVSVDSARLARASTATYATPGSVIAIVSPRSESEVQSAVRALNELQLPFHCRSGHANWGYGSRNARAGGSVLLSLSAMKAISVLDEHLGLVQVEPGVTVAELQSFVGNRLSGFAVSGPASSPEASAIGNLLDRGIGVGIDADRSKHLLSVRAVLPNADIADTAPTTGSHLTCHTSVLGPDASPLFLQSNLGVVTSARIRLHRPWRHTWTFGTSLGRRQLVNCIGRIATLLESPRTTAAIFAPGRLALEPGRTGHRTDWTLKVNFEARSALAVARATAGLVRSFGPGRIQRVGASRDSASTRSDLNILYGPRGPADRDDRDPDLDGVGVVFANAALPLRPQTLATCIAELENIFARHAVPLALSVRMLGPHDARLIVPIVWRREDHDGDVRAMTLYRAVEDWQTARGVRPYRLSTLDDRSYGSQQIIQVIKRAFDPNGLLDSQPVSRPPCTFDPSSNELTTEMSQL